MNVEEAQALLSIRHARRERAEAILLAARRELDDARAEAAAIEAELQQVASQAADLLLTRLDPETRGPERIRMDRTSLWIRRGGLEAAREAAARRVAEAMHAVNRALLVFVPSRIREEAADVVLTTLRRERLSAELRADERRMGELIELRAGWKGQ